MSLKRLESVLIAAAVLIGASATAVMADASPPSQILSNYENSAKADLDRDCGYSAPLPGDKKDSLWLFCDTAVYGFDSAGQWGLTSFITGSSAAEGPSTPGEVPTGLSEVPTPGSGAATLPNDNAPDQFLPTPSGLVTSGGQPCDPASGAYSASWITGVARDAARPSDVLISFNNYCVMSGDLNYLAEGAGVAEYNPATNKVDSEVTPFSVTSGSAAVPSQELLGAPVFSGGYLYLFGSHCNDVFDATCVSDSGNAVYLARVRANPADWAKSGDYQWYAGSSGWTSAPGSAGSVVSGATPLAVNVGDFSSLGHGLVMVEQTDVTGRFVVYQASSPAGPWTEETSGSVPCTVEGSDFCRALIPHPDLSTSGNLLISYFDPSAAAYYEPGEPVVGHLKVAAFGW